MKAFPFVKRLTKKPRVVQRQSLAVSFTKVFAFVKLLYSIPHVSRWRHAIPAMRLGMSCVMSLPAFQAGR